MRRGRLLAAVVMALIALVGYYGYREINPVTGEKQHIALSQEQEVALGLRSAPAMAAEFGGLHPDPVVQQQAESVGKRLVQQSVAGTTPYRFSFHVLGDQDTINAFALPGGPIHITWALLQKVERKRNSPACWGMK
jgi:beta-barrel assembly-enhancing protease